MGRSRRGAGPRGAIALAATLALATLAPTAQADGAAESGSGGAEQASTADDAITSRAFATASIEYANSVRTDGNGDLWPSCWADDGHLYAAAGDGTGFSDGPWQDIVVNRIEGHPDRPEGLHGERLSAGDDVAPVWSDPERYNRKPTGMVCVDGDGDGRDEIYLAVQDLTKGPEIWFDDAPASTVVVSRDYGRTWERTDEPMFSDHRFTTVMFLDYGQSAENRAVLGGEDADHVYAYGLDHNWRDSFSDTVPDPQDLYLARVPVDSITDRSAWEFFAGSNGARQRWSKDLDERVPVLHDERRVYTDTRIQGGVENLSVLSQGSIVYNEPLKRYLYTSWTEYTFEFYEAPTPWGPWKLFTRKDFGGYPWFGGTTNDSACPTPKHGGYATTIPSKFISADGKDMWIQSNWFVGSQCGGHDYAFTMRRMHVEPPRPGPATNLPDDTDNLARSTPGTTPVAKAAHFGHLEWLNDGDKQQSEDSFDWDNKPLDHWGYTWPKNLRADRVVYTTGEMFHNGGWFAEDLRVQVRRNGRWQDVPGLRVDPEYTYDDSVGVNRSYTLTFKPVVGNGIRIIGAPGGDHFTSIGELEVYYDGRR